MELVCSSVSVLSPVVLKEGKLLLPIQLMQMAVTGAVSDLRSVSLLALVGGNGTEERFVLLMFITRIIKILLVALNTTAIVALHMERFYLSLFCNGGLCNNTTWHGNLSSL
jgi:hypothetical protein